MAYPKGKETQRVLLKVLSEANGEIATNEVYDRVTKYFPNITEKEKKERFGIGEKRWPHIIRVNKARMSAEGLVISTKRGYWEITEKGKREIAG